MISLTVAQQSARTVTRYFSALLDMAVWVTQFWVIIPQTQNFLRSVTVQYRLQLRSEKAVREGLGHDPRIPAAFWIAAFSPRRTFRR